MKPILTILLLLLLDSCTTETDKFGTAPKPITLKTDWLIYNIDKSDTLSKYLFDLDYSDCHQIEGALISMKYWDQVYRDSLHLDKKNKRHYIKLIMKIDSINLVALKYIINKINLSCEFSTDMYEAYFYVAQHNSDTSLKYSVLPKIQEGIEKKKLDPVFLELFFRRFPQHKHQ